MSGHDGDGSTADATGEPSLQDVLDAFPHYVMLIDEHHRIVGANAALLDHFENPHDVIGGYCPAVIHGASGPIHGCPLEDAAATGMPHEIEIRDDGSGQWLRSGVYPLPERDGERRLFLHSALDVTAHKQSELRERDSLERLNATLLATVDVMARAVEAKDPYTAGHQQRVAELSAAIAEALGMSAGDVDGIRMAAAVHDLGKLNVPSEILNKPGRLTDEEFERIRRHPTVGSSILGPVEFPWPIARMVLQHHERLDGSGYPAGLAGDEIMPEARIIAVADVVEAMSLDRPYRAALGIAAALDEISRARGTLFDPDAVDACVRLFRRDGFRMACVNEACDRTEA